MTDPPMAFRAADRNAIRDALREQLDRYRLDVAAVAVSAKHVHVLAKLPVSRAKYVLGRAKYRATRSLRDAGRGGRVWAQGEGCKPIADCDHWSRAFAYILRHAEHQAATWSWDGPSVASATNPWRSRNDDLHRRPYEVVTDSEGGTVTILVDGEPYEDRESHEESSNHEAEKARS